LKAYFEHHHVIFPANSLARVVVCGIMISTHLRSNDFIDIYIYILMLG